MKTRAFVSAEVFKDGTCGTWMFEVKRSNTVGAVGTADSCETIVSMAAEAIGDVDDSCFKPAPTRRSVRVMAEKMSGKCGSGDA